MRRGDKIRILCLIALLTVAVIMDLKSYKVKNSLILIGLLLGTGFCIEAANLQSFLDGMVGFLIPFFLLFPLFFVKGLGGGDIKLMSVIGLFMGSKFVLQTIVYSFLAGGILSVLFLIRKHSFLKTYQGLIQYARFFDVANIKKVKSYYNKKSKKYESVIHFTVAIFCAVLYQVIFL